MGLRKAYQYFLILLMLASAALGLSSCSGDDVPQGKGMFTFIANHRIDFAPLVLSSTFAYETESGSLFKVYEFKYYISNVRLLKKGGGAYTQPTVNDGSEGFFLIDAADPESKLIVLEDVPVGEYTGVTFDVGVNAAEVDLPNATGPLAQSKGMYSPEHGYFSVWLEGMAYDSGEENQRMALRTGGNTQQVTIEFDGKVALVEDELETVVEFNADLGALFSKETQTDFAEKPVSLIPSENITAARQFSQAFSFDHLHNNP